MENNYSPTARRQAENMINGIRVKQKGYAVFEDGHKERTSVSISWHHNAQYVGMKAAKFDLHLIKLMLEEDLFDVTEVNSVTLKGEKECDYSGLLIKFEEHVTYHIEERW